MAVSLRAIWANFHNKNSISLLAETLDFALLEKMVEK